MQGLICPRCGAANGLGAMFRGLSSMSLNLIPIRCAACGELSSALRSLGGYVAFFLVFAGVFLGLLIAIVEALAMPELGIVPPAIVAAIVGLVLTAVLWCLLVLRQQAPDSDAIEHPGDISLRDKIIWPSIGLGLALLVIAAGVAAYEYSRIARRPPARAGTQEEVALSDAARAWRFRTLAGEERTLGAAADGVVFINVWATWCGPCVAELPSIARLRASVSTRDIDFVIVSTEDAETVREFAAEMELELPVVTATELPEALRTAAIPATFVVRHGRIVYRHVGAADWSDSAFRSWLTRL